jgi:hypothetical protein
MGKRKDGTKRKNESHFIHLRILNAGAFALALNHSCVDKMLSKTLIQ